MDDHEVAVAALAAVTKWAPRLGLNPRHVDVQIAALEEPSGADCVTLDEWGLHRIRLSANLFPHVRQGDFCVVMPFESDTQIVERLTLHELLHAVEQPIGQYADREIEFWLGNPYTAGPTATRPIRELIRGARETFICRVVLMLLAVDRGEWA